MTIEVSAAGEIAQSFTIDELFDGDTRLELFLADVKTASEKWEVDFTMTMWLMGPGDKTILFPPKEDECNSQK